MKINPKKQISKKYKTSIGYLEGTISIILNTLLFGLKYWVGIKTFSIAIIADAWHTLSDSLTSLVVIIGFKVSSKPADKKHPFGHGRAEIISSVIIGTMLAIVGFNFLIASINLYRKVFLVGGQHYGHYSVFGHLLYHLHHFKRTN
jgi:cation diffusion facilitator family transporter